MAVAYYASDLIKSLNLFDLGQPAVVPTAQIAGPPQVAVVATPGNQRGLLSVFDPYTPSLPVYNASVAAAAAQNPPGAVAARKAKERSQIVNEIIYILAGSGTQINGATPPAGNANEGALEATNAVAAIAAAVGAAAGAAQGAAAGAGAAAAAQATAFIDHLKAVLALNMEHQGVQIIRVPLVDELVRRAAVGLYNEYKLNNTKYQEAFDLPAAGRPGAGDPTNYMKGFSAKDSLTRAYDIGGDIRALEALNLLTVDQAKAKEWDSTVMTLRDKLSVRVSGPYSGFANAITKPKGLDVPLDGLAKTSAGTKTAIIFRRSSPPMGMIRQANPALYSGRLGVVVTRGGNGMVGGKVSASAPLYPSVVMNGGAHPFAVLEGGGDNYMLLEGNRFMPAQHVQDKFDRLLAQLNTLATPSVKTEIAKNGTVGQGIQTKIDSLNTELKSLRESFYQMDNAKTALSREPLGPGVDIPFADLAKRGEELNKKVQKVTNSWDKLMTIGEHLEELVSRLKPKPLKGGLHLHDAFKH
jgi:hypothetical protein